MNDAGRYGFYNVECKAEERNAALFTSPAGGACVLLLMLQNKVCMEHSSSFYFEESVFVINFTKLGSITGDCVSCSPLSSLCLWVCWDLNLNHKTEDSMRDAKRTRPAQVSAARLCVSPVKSLRNRCLHSVESAVAAWKCLQTADSLTTEPTSSSLRTLRRSYGGRAARPNATGRASAENKRHS